MWSGLFSAKNEEPDEPDRLFVCVPQVFNYPLPHGLASLVLACEANIAHRQTYKPAPRALIWRGAGRIIMYLNERSDSMRIACYARVSTEEQALHGLSIEAQLNALREFANDQSVGEYVDAGISARSSIAKRPELQRLLRDVEAGKVDLVVFTKLDR